MGLILRFLRVRGLVGVHALRAAVIPLTGVPVIWVGVELFIRNPERVWFADRVGVPITIAVGIAITLVFCLASTTLLWSGLRDVGVLPLFVALRFGGIWSVGTPASLLRLTVVTKPVGANLGLRRERPFGRPGAVRHPIAVHADGRAVRAALLYKPSADNLEQITTWLRSIGE